LLSWLRQNILTVNPDPRRGKQSRGAGFDSELRYKPWWIAQHLAAPASYSNSSASRGLDNYFVDHARMTRKEIAGLEWVYEHVAVMGGMSDRDIDLLLCYACCQPCVGE